MREIANDFCEIIDTYGGRDKAMKALCYSAKLLAGMNETKRPELAKKYAKFASSISGARATLRLIDDIPMIQYAIEYGLGTKEPDAIMSAFGVIANVVDLIYYPIEKICWLSDQKMLKLSDPDKWDTINSIFWALSVYLNLMRTLRNFSYNKKAKEANDDVLLSKDEMKKMAEKQRLEMLSILRLSLDFTHAVSTLPRGYLWGGKLHTWHVGFIGTTSALLGMYQLFAKRKLAKN